MNFPNFGQQTVIDAIQESLLVLAPMGTGKTRTAAAAMHRAIESGIKPEQVLGLTFTNRAAEAMRGALAEAIPKENHRIALFNLHGLCARLLREEGIFVHLPPDFSILDEDEAADLLWEFVPREDRKERYKNKPLEALNAYEKYVFNFLTRGDLGATPLAFCLYRDAMHRDGNVDFTGLIARTYRVLQTNAAVLERWQNRYQWILVDEVQDINLVEYRIIAILAGVTRCLKFFGDPHQTIYEWRFAQPQQVIDVFTTEFQPRVLALKINYRCTPALIEASNSLLKSHISNDSPLPEASPEATRDGQIQLHEFESAQDEAQAVVTQITEWHRDGIAWSNIAVIARQNRTLMEISSTLKTSEIPHLVAEEFDFFRRQEVKDVLAILQYLVAPFRRNPILRLLKRFDAKPGTLDALEKSIQGTGLHLGYLLRNTKGDPLYPLITAWEHHHVVALDTETTGLDPLTAEVIQLAKIPMHGSEILRWLKPKGSLGDSVRTHGITDEILLEKGEDPHKVFEEVLCFEPDQILLGHNLAFDLRLLRNQAARLGLEPTFPMWFDTMPLAATVLSREQLTGLRLETVATALQVPLDNAHDAKSDARACLIVLSKLIEHLHETQADRLRIISEMPSDLRHAFTRLSVLLHKAADLEMIHSDVHELILAVWHLLCEMPGQHECRSNPGRTKNIEDLAAIAQFLQERHGGILSLPSFLEQASLSRRDMMLEAEPNQVRLLTAHAAKGLEFDAVALPRLIQPWNGCTDEEARVFYVMLTRARRHLWMGWPKSTNTSWGEPHRVARLQYLSLFEKM